MENNVVEIIKDMYINHNPIDLIIETVNKSEDYIRDILKENQLDRKYNTFSDELYDRIIKLYIDGLTQKEIGDLLHVSRNGIVKTLDRNNIKRRTYSESNQHYYRNSYYFDCIDTQNKAYILGLLYADGCNHVEHNTITLSLQESDEYLIKSVKEELEYEGNIRKKELNKQNSNYKNQSVLVINDEHMSQQLEKCGVVNAKSLILKFPNFLDNNLLRHFCRGYFDGDGCIYHDIKRNKFSTCTAGTSEFCKSLSELLYQIGCKNNIRHLKQCLHNTEIIRTSGNKSSYLFLSWLYEDCELKMERKYQKYLLLKQQYEQIES